MLTEIDFELFKSKGIPYETIENQIKKFQRGFPFLDIVKPAILGDGIKQFSPEERQKYIALYDEKLKEIQVLKFVPASGAASRMFKKLFGFLQYDKRTQIKNSEDFKTHGFEDIAEFFEKIRQFAFFPKLAQTLEKQGENIETLLETKDYVPVLEALLSEKGMNYGNLPKGLLQFHSYSKGARTPVEEHLVEGALYAADKDRIVELHFTVSPEHKALFEKHLEEVKPAYEKEFGVTYRVSFSEQKPSTDTIAVDLQNEAFRNPDGSILFRPGGHGALIENLNDIQNVDVIFIKNIDNVVPDLLKEPTISYKKLLAGVLMHYQQKIFHFLEQLDEQGYHAKRSLLDEIGEFAEKELCILPSDDFVPGTKADIIACLRRKLNRPVRVCGMVKNQGEPGGGPFWATNPNRSVSLQIVESSQIDSQDPKKAALIKSATHFNPVDLVCAVKNYKGEKFNLPDYVDPQTGFISQKSQFGRELKAQELPGLWNGAMSDWVTIFVEVPIETFNPVKTINDLLRKQHQA